MEKVGIETIDNPEVENLDLAAETDDSKEKLEHSGFFSISWSKYI